MGQGGGGCGHPQEHDWDPVGQLLPWPNVYRNRKHYSYPACRGSLRPGRVPWALSGCCATESADYYLLVNEWAWLRSRLEVNFNSVLESELRQKWRYGAFRPKVVKNFKVILKSGKTCMYIHKHRHTVTYTPIYNPIFSFSFNKVEYRFSFGGLRSYRGLYITNSHY